jgi:hypothetical protein
MPSFVTLPDQPIVNVLHLAVLIRDAVKPDISRARGVACVTAKRVRHKQIPCGVPYPISDGDRDRLREVLPALPPIWSGMPKRLLKRFRAAYRKYSRTFGWAPIIASNEAIARNSDERLAIINKHIGLLDTMISNGTMRSFDSNHLPAIRYHATCFISRKDADAYLEKFGLAPYRYSAPVQSDVLTSSTVIGPPVLETEEPVVPQGTPQTRENSSPETGRTIGGRYFSGSELREIKVEQIERGRKFVVEKYGLSVYQAKQIGPTASGKLRVETIAQKNAKAEIEAAAPKDLTQAWGLSVFPGNDRKSRRDV